ERLRQPGIIGTKLFEGASADLGNRYRRDRADRVVHLAGHEHVEVANVARKKEGDGLSAGVLKRLVAAGPTRPDNAHRRGAVALAHDIFPRVDASYSLPRQSSEKASLLLGETGVVFELSNQRIVHFWL